MAINLTLEIMCIISFHYIKLQETRHYSLCYIYKKLSNHSVHARMPVW